MADPIVIPNLPGGYCASQDRMALLAELLNLNFDIFVDAWETAFSETIKLPGVTPMTLTMPGVNIPGLPGFSRTFSSAPPPSEYAWVGNRFPFQSGGAIVKGRYEFPGFPETIVDPRSVVIPGRDPMAITMDWVRINFEIMVTKFIERELTPPEMGFDVLSIITCQTDMDFLLNALNNAIGGVIGGVPGGGTVDGPPLEDSDISTFGPGTFGPGSCWEDVNGNAELFQLPDGTWAIKSSDGGDVRVQTACSTDTPCLDTPIDGFVNYGLTLHNFSSGGGFVFACDGTTLNHSSLGACGGTSSSETAVFRRDGQNAPPEGIIYAVDLGVGEASSALSDPYFALGNAGWSTANPRQCAGSGLADFYVQ